MAFINPIPEEEITIKRSRYESLVKKEVAFDKFKEYLEAGNQYLTDVEKVLFNIKRKEKVEK